MVACSGSGLSAPVSAFASQYVITISRYMLVAVVRCPGLAGLVIELTEAEVAVGGQRAHSEFACESERLAVVLHGVLED
jgi:hypothetical protein